MALKDGNTWVAVAGSLVALFVMVTTYIKSSSSSKEIAKHAEKMGEEMTSQNKKIGDNEEYVKKVEQIVNNRVGVHYNQIKKAYMTRIEVEAEFEKQSNRFDSQDELSAQRFEQLKDVQIFQNNQIDRIFVLLQDIHKAQVEGLQAEIAAKKV